MPDRFRLEQLRRRVEANPASIAFATLAEEYRRARMFDEAIDTCQRGLRRHPAYLSARVTLSLALMDAGRLDEAQAELETVLRSAPENLTAVRALARVHGLKTGEIKPVPPRKVVEARQLEALAGLLAAINQARTDGRAAR